MTAPALFDEPLMAGIAAVRRLMIEHYYVRPAAMSHAPRGWWKLLDLCAEHGASGLKAAPLYCVENGGLELGRAVWWAAINGEGETVAVSAAKLFDWRSHGRNARRAIEDGSFWSDYPDQAARVKARAPVEAEEVRGIVAHSGAAWVHPKLRRGRFAVPDGADSLYTLICAHTHFCTAAAWGVDFICTMYDRTLVGKHKPADAGYDRVFPGNALEYDGLDLRLGYWAHQGRERIVERARAFVAKAAALGVREAA